MDGRVTFYILVADVVNVTQTDVLVCKRGKCYVNWRGKSYMDYSVNL